MNCSSKYRGDIVRLRAEGKTCAEIADVLNCSISLVSYHSSDKQQEDARIARKRNFHQRKQSRKKGVERNRKYVDDFLNGKSCIDCGNPDVRVLEFDHVRGIKLGHISHAIRNAWNLEKLKEEIDKCEIRCCNCHRIATIERRKQKSVNQYL